MTPLESCFSKLNVDEDDPACNALSSRDRRKKRRLNAPREDSACPLVAGASELKRSPANRLLPRHSHHGGDELKDFYKEVAPGLAVANKKNGMRRALENDKRQDLDRHSHHGNTSIGGSSSTSRTRTNSSWCPPGRAKSFSAAQTKSNTLGSRFQNLLIHDSLLAGCESDTRRRNRSSTLSPSYRKSNPEAKMVQQLLAKVESIVDVTP